MGSSLGGDSREKVWSGAGKRDERRGCEGKASAGEHCGRGHSYGRCSGLSQEVDRMPLRRVPKGKEAAGGIRLLLCPTGEGTPRSGAFLTLPGTQAEETPVVGKGSGPLLF